MFAACRNWLADRPKSVFMYSVSQNHEHTVVKQFSDVQSSFLSFANVIPDSGIDRTDVRFHSNWVYSGQTAQVNAYQAYSGLHPVIFQLTGYKSQKLVLYPTLIIKAFLRKSLECSNFCMPKAISRTIFERFKHFLT